MPRSASDRKFGFKAPGLVRILTGADIQEVQKALEELGLEVQTSGFLDTLKELFDELFGPLFLIRELTAQVLDLIFGPVGTQAPRTQVQQVRTIVQVVERDLAGIASALLAGPTLVSVENLGLQINALANELRNAIGLLQRADATLSETESEAESLRANLEAIDQETEAKKLDFRRALGAEDTEERGVTTAVI